MGIAIGSREVPGRKGLCVDKRHHYDEDDHDDDGDGDDGGVHD